MASTERGASQTRGLANDKMAYAGANGDVDPGTAARGVYFDETLPTPLGKFFGTSKNQLAYDSADNPFGLPYNNTLFLMRGYYVSGAVWEVWTSRGSPSLTPPSGHTLVDKVIEAMRQ